MIPADGVNRSKFLPRILAEYSMIVYSRSVNLLIKTFLESNSGLFWILDPASSASYTFS